jgi:hypothetical protein
MLEEPYNDGHTHEALHMTSVLIDMVERYVGDTRCAAEFPDVYDAVKKTSDALADLYQLIGSKFNEES